MSTSSSSPLPETYVKLALAIEQHVDGYIDSYFGPPEWRTEAQTAGKQPLADLFRRADALAAALKSDSALEPARVAFLAAQVRAMQTSLALLQGETLSLTKEVEALYDITPRWTDASEFDAAHQILNELLPPGSSLRERMFARRDSLRVPLSRVEPLVPGVLADLRARTQEKYPLPQGESFEFAAVKNKPWGAYNWYLGSYHSLIEWNTDLPAAVNAFPSTLAHEGYPGHHTEHSIKDHALVQSRGWLENSLTLINAPECVISEGIASTALDNILTPQEQLDLFQHTIYRALGLELDAVRESEIDRAAEKIAAARTNAAFLLHDQKQTAAQVSAYLQRYGLLDEPLANKAIEFQSHPLYRSYIFTYSIGKELLQQLFAARGTPDIWFGRLLTEPVTPAQIRNWIADSSTK